ncbi:MAG TPA: bifunctional sulfate adenylyltransferase/adenylylsulfate kinase [Pyrinomonadaceae bacterium]
MMPPLKTDLIAPCGGELVDLVAERDGQADLARRAQSLHSIQITSRAVHDLELLAVGAFSPLKRFMGREDYRSVLDEMRLANGHLFPIPLTLSVPESAELKLDREVVLRDAGNELLALMTIEEIYDWDLEHEARQVYGTMDLRHPLVAEMHGWGKLNIAGRLRVINLPRRHSFSHLRLTPATTRARLKMLGHSDVVAFQTRNFLHRAHEEMIKRAAASVNGTLLLHPVVGMTKPGDTAYHHRVRTYQALTSTYFDPRRTLLALLPLAMRMAGPREALWHAQVRRNYGANYLIVGRDHASPGTDSNGRPFYEPYAAQELVGEFESETGVRALPFEELVYLPESERYVGVSEIPVNERALSLSASEARELYLARGKQLPEWFVRPEVSQVLREAYPPMHQSGFCVWFTGLSAAGKSTTAEVLTDLLLEYGRSVTLLDGDVVRTHLSAGLGFSKEDRDTNIRRIGFVASEIVRHGGVVICAAVSPYQTTRDEVRSMVGGERFIEVFVNTPLEVCEQRDPKGMYARARSKQIRGFTGVGDPYEPPPDPEITLETIASSPEQNAELILKHLLRRGFIRRDSTDD